MEKKVKITEKRFKLMVNAISAMVRGKEEDFHLHLNRLLTEELGIVEKIEE